MGTYLQTDYELIKEAKYGVVAAIFQIKFLVK